MNSKILLLLTLLLVESLRDESWIQGYYSAEAVAGSFDHALPDGIAVGFCILFILGYQVKALILKIRRMRKMQLVSKP